LEHGPDYPPEVSWAPENGLQLCLESRVREAQSAQSLEGEPDAPLAIYKHKGMPPERDCPPTLQSPVSRHPEEQYRDYQSISVQRRILTSIPHLHQTKHPFNPIHYPSITMPPKKTETKAESAAAPKGKTASSPTYQVRNHEAGILKRFLYLTECRI
jgi:hypothetical protein